MKKENHQLSINEVEALVSSNIEHGLSSMEAEQRLLDKGFNEQTLQKMLNLKQIKNENIKK